jgi:lipid II:glycine glycyltransferase (peptidoglycan interpeptide bridge formation enzyme)
MTFMTAILDTQIENPTILTGEYDIHVSEMMIDPVWDSFLANTPGGHHVQSSLWARVKALNHWKVSRIIARAGEEIVGGAQLLIRPLPLQNSVVYVSKGPIVFEQNIELIRKILQKVISVARKFRVQLLALQPPGNSMKIDVLLSQLGFSPSALELAPVASLLLDLSIPIDQILKNMKRQTRQNIRRGEGAGLTVRMADEKDLDIFYEFHKLTGQRQGFNPYPKEYYLHMWRTFAPQGFIRLLMAEYDGSPISGLLLITFGDTVIAKILGWSGRHPDLRPNDALFWNAIQWSKLQGFHYFDFEGINVNGAKTILAGQSLPSELQHSPDFLKLGYGGQVVLYPAAFEMLPNPLVNWVYKKASPTIEGDSFVSHLVDRLRKN